MADQIQILRGTRDEIVTAKTKLLEGQPLYNETDKYLTIGSSAGLLPKEQSPIKVRAIEGYVEDNKGTLSSSPTEADRYYVGPTNDVGNPTLLMHGTNLEVIAKGTGVSEGLLSIKGKDVNITGTNMLNVTSSGSIQLSASDLNISGLGFEVHSTDTNDGGTVIKMGTNTGIGGNYVKIGYTGATGSTSVYNISIDTNFDTDQIYTAPAGTPKIDAVGATGTTYAENSAEKRLAPIIYNIGQRLDSLGFKELGGDFNSAFEFELKKTYKSESGGSATFTLGTLKIAPQDVMGNYCRAVVKFEPVQIDKVKLTATDYDYTHASNDDQRRLLFYCSTYFLYEPATGKLITDVTGESDFSYNNMNRFNNTVITPAEEIEFSFPFSIDVYSTYAGGDLVLEAASITVHFVLTPPGADGKTRVQMKIHSQNFNAIAQTYRIRIPGEATINPFPIIAYKRKI